MADFLNSTVPVVSPDLFGQYEWLAVRSGSTKNVIRGLSVIDPINMGGTLLYNVIGVPCASAQCEDNVTPSNSGSAWGPLVPAIGGAPALWSDVVQNVPATLQANDNGQATVSAGSDINTTVWFRVLARSTSLTDGDVCEFSLAKIVGAVVTPVGTPVPYVLNGAAGPDVNCGFIEVPVVLEAGQSYVLVVRNTSNNVPVLASYAKFVIVEQ